MIAKSHDDVEALAQLRAGLVGARRLFDAGEHSAARGAVGGCFVLLGAVYARLDASAHPVVIRRLQAVYDSCLALLGKACLGDVDSLERAIALVTPMRGAMTASSSQRRITPSSPASSWSPSLRPASLSLVS